VQESGFAERSRDVLKLKKVMPLRSRRTFSLIHAGCRTG
jgi:hypothetical protein